MDSRPQSSIAWLASWQMEKIVSVHVFLFSHPLDLSHGLCSIIYRARGRYYTFACGNFSKSWGICWVQYVSYLDAFKMGLMRDFVTIASELLKEPHSLPTAQAVAAEANSTQMLSSPPAETEQNQKLGGTSIYSNFSFT